MSAFHNKLDYQEVEQYRPRLMRQAKRLVHDQATAEDLVQECLLRAWQGLSGFRGESTLYTWLYRILLNGIYNHLKTVKRHKIQFTDEHDEQIGLLDSATPDMHLIALQRAQELLEGLESLTKTQYETLTLRYLHDHSYEEIATELGIPVGTVRSRLSHIRTALGLR